MVLVLEVVEKVMGMSCFGEEEGGDVGEGVVVKMELELDRVEEELALAGVGWLAVLGRQPRGRGYWSSCCWLDEERRKIK